MESSHDNLSGTPISPTQLLHSGYKTLTRHQQLSISQTLNPRKHWRPMRWRSHFRSRGTRRSVRSSSYSGRPPCAALWTSRGEQSDAGNGTETGNYSEWANSAVSSAITLECFTIFMEAYFCHTQNINHASVNYNWHKTFTWDTKSQYETKSKWWRHNEIKTNYWQKIEIMKRNVLIV